MTHGPFICHVDELEWQEVRAQRHGDRRASVWNRFVDVAPDRTVIYTRYDAGMILARHSHHSDEVILIVNGELMIGDERCRAGSVVVLEAGESFGPLIAGDEGVVLFEVFNGPPARAGQDQSEFQALLRERSIVELDDIAPFHMPAPR